MKDETHLTLALLIAGVGIAISIVNSGSMMVGVTLFITGICYAVIIICSIALSITNSWPPRR